MRRSAAAVGAVGVLVAGGCGSAASTHRQGSVLTPEQARGKALFVRACSACHTLADAGTRGSVGKNLDETRPGAAAVLRALAVPPQNMPAGLATGADARAVAAYVARVAGR